MPVERSAEAAHLGAAAARKGLGLLLGSGSATLPTSVWFRVYCGVKESNTM